MELLIDGDIVAYKAAAACDGREYRIEYELKGNPVVRLEKYKKDATQLQKELEARGIESTVDVGYSPESFNEVKKCIDNTINTIRAGVGAHAEVTGMRLFISRNGSFREKEVPSYKNNREGTRRPHHLEEAKNYLLQKYGAFLREGKLEADDLMAMEQTDDTIICSIDKDLLQVPGNHYNWDKKKFRTISEVEGNRHLYKQMLTGDTADGIPGIPGVGPVAASKMIDHLHTPFAMYCTVLKAYIDKMPLLKDEDGRRDEKFLERMVHLVRSTARLLYLLRSEKDSWEAPYEEDSGRDDSDTSTISEQDVRREEGTELGVQEVP